MKSSLKKVICIFILLLISMQFSLFVVSVHAADNGDTIVYITRTGEKYHRNGCSYLSKSKIAVTLSDAVSRGYTPCSRCAPPVYYSYTEAQQTEPETTYEITEPPTTASTYSDPVTVEPLPTFEKYDWEPSHSTYPEGSPYWRDDYSTRSTYEYTKPWYDSYEYTSPKYNTSGDENSVLQSVVGFILTIAAVSAIIFLVRSEKERKKQLKDQQESKETKKYEISDGGNKNEK